MQEGALLAELKIGGGSLFAHRAFGTTYAAHSPELKVIEPAALKLKYKIIIPHSPLSISPSRGEAGCACFLNTNYRELTTNYQKKTRETGENKRIMSLLYIMSGNRQERQVGHKNTRPHSPHSFSPSRGEVGCACFLNTNYRELTTNYHE